MPKQTFLNLPEEKRAKIEQAAINEFTAYSYDQASTNRIVEAAEIPKGSFYQYFAGKKDLYRHILDKILERKMEFLTPVMANPMEMDFFQLLRETYVAGLRFATSNPELQQISQRLMADRNHPVFVEFIQDNMGKADDVFRQLIQLGISRGELREDLDVAFAAHIISEMNNSVADFYKSYVKQTMDDDYLNMVDKLLDFLRRGIGSSEQVGS
ncbi:MAG: TetR/AcrR family transcriptional regulator [Clostridiaceae bacterium]|nr:TetR/AcrR family transcriptional regulator [Clostridiaceae bacterium]